jgi:hypothetical protein
MRSSSTCSEPSWNKRHVITVVPGDARVDPDAGKALFGAFLIAFAARLALTDR